MPDATRAAYLFQCTDEDLYAVSHDMAGAILKQCQLFYEVLNSECSAELPDLVAREGHLR